jgi:hypothetical protein
MTALQLPETPLPMIDRNEPAAQGPALFSCTHIDTRDATVGGPSSYWRLMLLESQIMTLHKAANGGPATTTHYPIVRPIAPVTVVGPVKVPVTAPAPSPGPVAVATVFHPGQLIFLDPRFRNFTFPVPRPSTAFNLPVLISPVATPNDQTLFNEPQGGPQHYLPQYQLAFTGSGTEQTYNVSLAVSGSAWLLTVHLQNITDMSVVSNRKAEMPLTRYFLQANLPGRTQTWDFPSAIVDSTSVTLTMPISDTGTLGFIRGAMTDLSVNTVLIVRRSPSLALPVPVTPTPGQPPPPQLYRQSPIAIDSSIPFWFDKEINQSVFANLGAVGGGAAQLISKAVQYPADGTKSYPYWQDPQQPEQIYYLPDAYKIARLATSPHTPSMSVTTLGSDPETLNVTLTFLAVPVTDPGRIAAAVGPAKAAFGLPPSATPSFTILAAAATAIQLQLSLPAPDPSAGSSVVTVNNLVPNTATGIQGSITMGLLQFQQVYLGIFSEVPSLLSGLVTVTEGDAKVDVPFSGQASDFTGDIFDVSVSYDSSTQQVTVVATNAIESPIKVSALPMTLLLSGDSVPFTVSSISPALPVALAPAPVAGSAAATSSSGAGTPLPPSAVTAVLQLAAAQPLDSTYTVQLDLTHVEVDPNSVAIWQAIVANQVVPVQRPMLVKLVAEVFQPQSANVASASSSSASAGQATSVATEPLNAVQVVFQNGQTVTFDPSMQLTGDFYTVSNFSLNVDMKDYILGLGSNSSYTYRVDQHFLHSTQQGPWKTRSGDLIVEMDD